VRAGVFLKARNREKIQKDSDLQKSRRKAEAKNLEESKEGVVTRDHRRTSSVERRHPVWFVQRFSKERTDGRNSL
jgi:hypothetical protein